MTRMLIALIIACAIISAGCETVVETQKSGESSFGAEAPPPQKLTQKSSQKDRPDPLSGAKMSAAAVTNGAASATKGIGDGFGWFCGEMLRPFSAMRDGFVDTFGVVQKEK